MELCELAAKKSDPKRLMTLTEEIVACRTNSSQVVTHARIVPIDKILPILKASTKKTKN
jgi:hypothetical protein